MRTSAAKERLDSTAPAIAACAARLGQDRLAASVWDAQRPEGEPDSHELFGMGLTWPECCKAAGLLPPRGRPRRPVTTADCERVDSAYLEAWRATQRAGGTRLLSKNYDAYAAKHGLPSRSEVARTVGSHQQVAERNGVPIGRLRSIDPELDPELKALAHRIADKVGRSPTMRDWNKNCLLLRGPLVSPHHAKRLAVRFGGWRAFLRQCGL